MARRTICTPIFSSASKSFTLSSAFCERRNATPPPGTMPSSTAARVACNASSTRAFFSLGLGRSADVDDCNAAGEFRQALLQFLFVVIAGRLFNLTTDLRDAALDIGRFTSAFDDRGVFLVDSDAFG